MAGGAPDGLIDVETAPPDGEAPVEWRLLTTLDVRDAKDAAEIVDYYLQR